MVEWLADRVVTNYTLAFSSILTFFVLVLAHEFGHYIAARLLNVRVERFVLGLGKEVWWHKDRRGTRWSLCLLPLYGFVSLGKKPSSRGAQDSFDEQPVWRKSMIVGAGPFASFLFALMLLFGFYTVFGRPAAPPVVTGVLAGSPADLAGVRPGDIILSVNGDAVRQGSDIFGYLEGAAGTVSFTVKRGEQTFNSQIIAEAKPVSSEIGITIEHNPIFLTNIRAINGELTGNDPGLTRDLVLANLGRVLQLEIGGVGAASQILKLHPHRDTNEHLFHNGPAMIYPGRTRGNIFLSLPIEEALRLAIQDTGRLIPGLLSWARNIWHVDKAQIRPVEMPSFHNSEILFRLFRYLYVAAVMSLALGLITLLPLPRLDGYFLVRYIVEALTGPEHAEKTTVYVSTFLAFTLFGWLLASNVTAAVAGY